MVGDFSNRSFREMATSDGDTEREPFESPLLPISRTDDRGTGQLWTPQDPRPTTPQPGQTRFVDGPAPQPGQTRLPYGQVAPPALSFDAQNPNPTPNRGSGQTRLPYGDVAPPARGLDTQNPNPTPYNGGGQTRLPYGDVAPPARGLDTQNPNPTPYNGGGQTRLPYGDVAPPARGIDAQNPNPTPYNGGGQTRLPYGDVAPPARQLPPMDGGAGNPAGGYNGGLRPPGDPGQWRPVDPGNGQIGQPGGMPQQPGQIARSVDPLPTVGPNATGGLRPASDAERRNAEQSLNTQLNYFRHFGEAALGGLAGASVVPYVGDRLVFKTGLQNTAVGRWWERNHSPLGLELRTRNGDLAALNAEIKALREGRPVPPGSTPTDAQVLASKPLTGVDAAGKLTGLTRDAQLSVRDVVGRRAVVGPDGSIVSAPTGMRAVQELHRTTTAARDAAVGPQNAILAKKAEFIEEFMRVRPQSHVELGEVRSEIQRHRIAAGAKEATENSFLTADEAKLLRQQTDRYERMMAAQGNVADRTNAIKGNEQAAAALETEIANIRAKGGNFPITGKKTWTDTPREGASGAEREFSTWKGENKWRAAGEGIAVAATGLAVNYAVDKFAPNVLGLVGGKDAHLFTKHNYWLMGPAVSAALLWPNKNFVQRLAMTAGSVGVASAIDWVAPGPPNATYSRLMQPNWVDSFLMPAAWMMPFGSLRARATAVVGTYALGRAANGLDGVMEKTLGFGIHGIGDHHFATGMNDDVTRALAHGKISKGSFDDIVSKSKTLGLENEGQLNVQMSDFMNSKEHDPLYHLHGSAALYTAWGDLFLERGTKVDRSKMNDKGRILTGTEYDLGCQATGFYRQAMANVVEAQNQAAQAGKKAEQEELAKAQKEIMKRLDAVYGEHNMQDVYDKLSVAYRQDISNMAHLQESLKRQVDGLNNATRDSKYAAKMCRDLAILSIAIAAYKAQQNEGLGAQIMFDDGVKYLQAAERIDPASKDAPQIRKIAENLAPRIPRATQNQMNNGFNNPFGVR